MVSHNVEVKKYGIRNAFILYDMELELLLLQRVAVSFAIQINLIHFCFTIDTLAVLSAIPAGMNNIRIILWRVALADQIHIICAH